MNKIQFAVNQVHYGQDEMERIWRDWSHLPPFQYLETGNKTFAVCLADAAELIMLVLYLRRHGANVLLLHGETPIETAKALAAEAGCSGLVYGSVMNGYCRISPTEAHNGLQVPADEGSLLLFSSGTSGKPKLIRRTWTAVDEEIAAYNKALDIEQDAVSVVISPVSHAYGLISGVLSAMARSTVPHIAAYTNPKLTMKLLKELPRHIVYGVPMTLHTLASFASASGFRFDRLMSSGAPLTQGVLEKLTSLSNGGLYQQYGCSEAGCISVNRSVQSCENIGKPLEHIRIIEAGASPSSMKELIVAVQDRSIRTGDLGYMERGELRILSRVDDVINVSGLKVYPLEVENVISELDGVHECVVYRGKHPVMGEIVTCMAAAEQDMTAEEIRARCKERLAPYKVPGIVKLVDQLPRNRTGKVSRKQLEEAGL